MSETPVSATLDGITPDRYRQIQLEAQKNGVVFTGNVGKDKGVEVEFSYDGVSTLRISVLKVPRIFGHDVISPEKVIQKIQAALQPS